MANFTYEFVTEAIIEMNNFDDQTYTVGCVGNSEAFKIVIQNVIGIRANHTYWAA